MKAVLIPGDGIGREIAESVRAVSTALNTGIEWQEFAAGAEYAAESGELIAPGTLDAIEACGWALKGPTATPIGKEVGRPVGYANAVLLFALNANGPSSTFESGVPPNPRCGKGDA